MSEFVVIRLMAEDQAVEWMLADSNGTRRSQVHSGSLEQAAEDVGDRAVIALVPAEDVLSTTVNVPAKSTSRIRTALPFALEEDLADDVESLHFALGTRGANGRLPVVIVSNESMNRWLDRLSAAGLKTAVMTPEYQGLSKIPGTLSVLVDDDLVMFNDGGDTEFVMRGIKPSDALVLAGELTEEHGDAAEKTGHLMVFCTPEQDERLSHDWIALRHELASVDVNVLPDGILPKLAVTVAAGHGINLLQGSFGKKTEYSTMFRPWRAAALLLLSLIFVTLMSKGASYYNLQKDESALRAAFNAEYQLIQPDDTRDIVDPTATIQSLQRRLGTAAVPHVFLPCMRELGAALAKSEEVTIEIISYRAGIVDLRLTTPDVATLDSIQKAVSASGRFQASIQRTDQVADRIDGRIQIRESGQ